MLLIAAIMASLRQSLNEVRARVLASIRHSAVGAIMLENLVAVTVLSTVATAALVGLSTANIARGKLDGQAQAEYATRNMMECIFGLKFQTTTTEYSTSTCASAPSDYTITNIATTTPEGLQRIAVIIRRGDKTLLEVETIRASLDKLRYESR